MKINSVSVTYGELKSEGYPKFTNKRYEITLSATLAPEETARQVKDKLTEIAKREVKLFFGENPDQTELDLPF